LLPSLAFASCSKDGATVVYINGINTTRSDAQLDSENLRDEFVKATGSTNVKFLNAYNQTSGVVLDVWKLTSQMLAWDPASWNEDTTGDHILEQMHNDLTTQRVVLVGYSQGAFYANETYKYLTMFGGVKPAALANFAVGTPASYVAGNGAYMTSFEDSKVAEATRLAAQAGLAHPLPPDINIPTTTLDATGHQFTTSYLAGASSVMVGELQSDIAALQPTTSSDQIDCFVPPSNSLVHKVLVGTNGVGMSLGTLAYLTGASAYQGTLAAVDTALGAADQVVTDIKTTIGGVYGLAHAANGQYDSTNYSIVNRLYNGKEQTVDGESLKDLLGASQGGAVILATEDVPARPTDMQQPASTSPLIPTNTTPGFGGGGGGFSPAQPVADTQTPAASVASSTQNSLGDTPTPTPPATEPLVINEVAWGGGYNAPTQQWVEMYNNGSDPVSLDDIVLASADGSLYIPLSGSIAGHGYYLLLSSDSAIYNIKITGWNYGISASLALGATPVQLLLMRTGDNATTTLDSTPAAGACGGSWCAGVASASSDFAASGGQPPLPVTMERVSPDVEGRDAGNWASADGYAYVANDANQQRIIGTPYSANSLHWPMAGFVCNGDSSVLAIGGTYTYRPASNDCHYLSGYSNYNWSPEALLLKGTVGSSTIVTKLSNASGPYKDLQTDANHRYDFADANSGDTFTVILFEFNNNVGGSYGAYYLGDMETYMQTGVRNDGVTTTAPYAYQSLTFVLP